MNIGIIGPGRLGRSLDALLSASGHTVRVTGRFETPPTADIVLLTVPDRAIGEAARRVAPGPILLHCSGACDIDVLRPHAPAGSFHPLMTFPGPEIALPDLTDVPAAVAGDPVARDAAVEIAHALNMRPFEVSGDRRLYHAAAVMAGNYATVLLAEAARVLAATGVDPQQAPGLLLPLALQSLRNAGEEPAQALTGPVARGDDHVLDAHRMALLKAGLFDLEALYSTLTEHAISLRSSHIETGNDR